MNAFLELRLLVGYLGEKHQHGWWQSEFFSPPAMQFLAPAFPRTAHLAQYRGVILAGRRVHDEHIGVGHVFHIFRLPEEVEQDLHRLAAQLNAESAIIRAVSDPAVAAKTLDEIAGESTATGQGPIAIASIEQLRSKKVVTAFAANYARAFAKNIRLYPYLTA